MIIDRLQPFMQQTWKEQGFSEPTAIQNKAIPEISEGNDLIAVSPTGSGKTLAYLLPLIEKIDPNKKQLQVLILASSHELVMQIYREVQLWTSGSSIGATTLIGGANVKRQLEKLKKKPQLIVGTPGRVFELIKQKKLKMHQVESIVLDEADQLFVPEHRDNLSDIIKSTPSERQIVLFSATISNQFAKEAEDWMKSPVHVQVNRNEAGTPPVNHGYVVCEAREKADLLRKLTRNHEWKALVFFRDIGNLTVIAEKLEYRGLSVAMLHSDVKKQDREKAIRLFSKDEIQLMLATDVAARGLDLKQLQHVIQLDVPRSVDQYLHRSGRTGRLGSTGGSVLSIVTVQEAKELQSIGNKLDLSIVEYHLQKGKLTPKHETSR
ncbi:superfamily II DNA/RNA helicase [Natronobacillus azotifigens]|uniref:DEAD/DEAH box helicase n=1 Tax=Natronobacillus azotifigens TaxID=472978 RepID=A0A9J6R942_9BACI|nr:DEAD/DEAH box helicase [Natronobacillus azotifigens]MCZ0702186.1 DEAD/DEAH box helicase [Natronobacillus azotifigens]